MAPGGAPAQQVWVIRSARGCELTAFITKLLNSSIRAEGRNELCDVAILSRVQDDERRTLRARPRGPPHSGAREDKPEMVYFEVEASARRVRGLGV